MTKKITLYFVLLTVMLIIPIGINAANPLGLFEFQENKSNVWQYVLFAFLIITIIIEFIIYKLLLKSSAGKLLIISIFLNTITTTAVILVFNYLFHDNFFRHSYNIFQEYALIEIFVILIETIILGLATKTNLTKALYVSFLANLVTSFFGIFYIMIYFR